MSEVTLCVLDARRSVQGRIHGACADRVVGALAAEPETIEELEVAVTRFDKPVNGRGVLAGFQAGGRLQPWDAGIVVVDLAARLVACWSSYSSPGPQGWVDYHDGHAATRVQVHYQLPEDWRFLNGWEGMESWRPIAAERRQERAASPPLDTRAVLYGQLTEFLVRECLAARQERREDPVAEIHARWLMTPRDALRGQTPRELLLARREWIEQDLQSREDQWTRLGECPPGLPPESAAYRFGGFGTHENVLYYELVRYLLQTCWDELMFKLPLQSALLQARLEQLKEQWLQAPQEDLYGMSPRQLIDRERTRLPLELTPEQAMIDCDCSLCRMMAEDGGLTFWHLDDCNMDEDFAFSFHRTRQQWEDEQREWQTLDRKWEQEQQDQNGRPMADAASSLWRRNYAHPDVPDTLPVGQAVSVMLFGIGGHLAEMGLELAGTDQGEALAESLRQHFANLRWALREAPAERLPSLLEAFCQELDAVAATRADLGPQCADLQNQLERLQTRAEAPQ